MRLAAAGLADALTGAFDTVFEADLYYGDTRVVASLPVADVQVVWDASAAVESSGSLSVVWADPAGVSLMPLLPGDWLAPFGARVMLFVRVRVGVLDVRVRVGVFTVVSVPSARDDTTVWEGRRIAVGSVVELEFKDLMVEVQRDRFTRLSSPTNLSSVYAELMVLTGFQLTRTVADAPITRSVVYEEDRLKAVRDVAAILGGEPFMQSDGTLSIRPIVAAGAVAKLQIGATGTIVQTGSQLDSEGVYNGVIIRGETDGQTAVLAERWITEGPLRATLPGGVRTPFHRVPKFYSSPFITTQVQAEAAIGGLLNQISQPRASQLDVTCVLNPLLQLGDVVLVDDSVAVWSVRLVKISYDGPVMQIVGDVLSRTLNRDINAPVVVVVVTDPPGFGEGGFGEGAFGS